MNHAPKKMNQHVVDVVVATQRHMLDVKHLNKKIKSKESYADAAKAIRTDISVHTEKTQNTEPPTKTHVYPKSNNSQEKQ